MQLLATTRKVGTTVYWVSLVRCVGQALSVAHVYISTWHNSGDKAAVTPAHWHNKYNQIRAQASRGVHHRPTLTLAYLLGQVTWQLALSSLHDPFYVYFTWISTRLATDHHATDPPWHINLKCVGNARKVGLLPKHFRTLIWKRMFMWSPSYIKFSSAAFFVELPCTHL